MAKLVKCPACKKKLSADAPICPHCGHPMQADSGTPPKKKKQVGCLGWGLIIFVGLGLFGAVLNKKETDTPSPHPVRSAPAATPAPTNTPKPTATPEPTATPLPTDPKERTEALVRQALRHIVKPNDIKTLRLSEQDPGTFLVQIDFHSTERATHTGNRDKIERTVYETVKALSEIPEVNEVFMRPFMTLVDQYGNEKEGQVGKFVIRRDVFSKINWDNLYTAGFVSLLKREGQYSIHQSLQPKE